MFTVAARARTMLALGILTSAVLWGIPVWDHFSAQDDRLDLAAAITVTLGTALAGCSWRAHAQRERMREAYQRDRVAFTRILAAQLSPQHDGDGDRAPQRPERPAWVLYQKEPA